MWSDPADCSRQLDRISGIPLMDQLIAPGAPIKVVEVQSKFIRILPRLNRYLSLRFLFQD
jgi:hypothetical protein